MSVVVARARQAAPRELTALERDTSKLETVQAAVPAHHLRRGGRACCEATGQPFEWGGDFGGADETVLSRAVRPAGLRPPLPGGGQGVLHEARSGAARGRARRRRARARGLRRDHRRRPARGRLRPAAPAHRGAQAAAGSVRLVSRPAPLRLGAARRLRHGHRARRRLDLRPRARARDHPVSAHAVSAVSRDCRCKCRVHRSPCSADGTVLRLASRSACRSSCIELARHSVAPGTMHCSTPDENRSRLARLPEEPRRLRGDARASPRAPATS